jgi:hypothetical protein
MALSIIFWAVMGRASCLPLARRPLDDSTESGHVSEEVVRGIQNPFGAWRHGNPDDATYELKALHEDDMNDCLHTMNRTAPMEGEQNIWPHMLFDGGSDIEGFLQIVDHIYVLCVVCTRTLPASLMDKVSYANGYEIDACFGGQGERLQKVTNAHQLVLAHARNMGYSNALVLEEDAIFDQETKFDFTPFSALVRDDNTWEVVWLQWEYAPRYYSDGPADSCRGWCTCHTGGEQNMCTVPSPNKCRMRGTGGYLVSSRAFDEIIASDRTCDSGLLETEVGQIVMFPAIIHQGNHFESEVESEEDFISHCLQ